ncbi:ubiquinone/menaquinone biosynthesis methyltransferase [Roseobacter cerasinus]|uniref:Ubiquinone/menaquinone biosynthesis methyltransferase n=1 Tax=Roseobacter cerasinus TaxID=2602289 RepID=A0A640VXL4_9RHOB|nr:class I SAM-dependent methyltransferase [Roseobacter cerasinus]GFE51695.1 ubiquinone/menaquinone biosynthesis methyltransferase [Roseobacter cerasinus]
MTAYWDAFFTLHRDLPREGPGEPADVAWAVATAGTAPTARICDAACGPGADITALRAAAPQGHVTALDKYPHFIDQAQRAHGTDPAVTLRTGDMADITGPFDLIWCAGALYFLGITEGLKTWRDALAPGGAVAFSEPCWFTEARPQEAADLWSGDYPAMTDAKGIDARVRAARYRTIGTRKLSSAAWENYYAPMDARIAALSSGDTPEMQQVLAEARREAQVWRAHRKSFGYLLSVVQPDDL